MDLLLWRHAEAEDISADGSDAARRLTPRGEQQAAAMGRWLRKHGPRDMAVLVSPAIRTQQTASALERPFETVRAIAPGAETEALIAASGWPDARFGKAVLLVGHQPTLGLLAARLMTGRELPWSVKKGALWWLHVRQRTERSEAVLKLVLPAEMV